MRILKKRDGGFTLVEMMMSLGCGSLILAAVVTAGVALQRSYAAVELYSTTEDDQLRVLDYIAMDCRRANSVFVAGNVLTLTLPVYYNSSNSNAANQPTLTTGLISYGPTGASVTVNYQQSGSTFTREVVIKNSSGTTTSDTTSTIATKVSSFTVTPLSQSSTNGTVECNIMFFPTFLHNAGSGTWRSGQYTPDQAPDSSIGVDGDWYVIVPNDPSIDHTIVGDVYFKSGGSYSKIENVKATQVYCNIFLRNTVARQ
jgi:Tfp pilus assembly protein PilW